MENNKYVLVTGGAGYIGSHTVVELIESGFTPIVLDDFRNSESFVISNASRITSQEIEVVQAACQATETLDALFQKYQFAGVIHFAADKAVGESVQNPLKYYDNNINGLLSILKMMEKYNTKNLIFSSSCSVYGNPEKVGEPIVETIERLAPESPYGNTKLICEQIIRHWITSNPTSNAVLLRYFNPIGAHPSALIGELPQGIPNNLLPYITQTAVGIRPALTVFGSDYQTPDGTCIRDYIHVCDLAQAHVKALNWSENQSLGTMEVFNVGTGKGTSVLEMISTFEKVSGISLHWEFGPRRDGDVQEIFAEPTKIQQKLGWKAQFTIEDAIRDAWRWEQNRLDHA